MCTVTYIPESKKNPFILTSNRDEKDIRPTIAPKIYVHKGICVAYPKDVKAGGSWIATNEQGRLCCLLNGAYEAHKKQTFHTQSRGAILIELTSSSLSTDAFFRSKSLMNVEPFTILCIHHSRNKVVSFQEFVWDGTKKHYREPNKNTPHIWSSATLYNAADRQLRRKWFSQFYTAEQAEISHEKIYSFHAGSHTKDSTVNVLMKRNGGLKTVSITQVSPKENQLKMRYTDLITDTTHAISI